MLKTYLIDGQQVTVTWKPQRHPTVYTIHIAGVPLVGTVEETVLANFLARDQYHRPLGAYTTLPRAVEQVVREKRR